MMSHDEMFGFCMSCRGQSRCTNGQFSLLLHGMKPNKTKNSCLAIKSLPSPESIYNQLKAGCKFLARRVFPIWRTSIFVMLWSRRWDLDVTLWWIVGLRKGHRFFSSTARPFQDASIKFLLGAAIGRQTRFPKVAMIVTLLLEFMERGILIW